MLLNIAGLLAFLNRKDRKRPPEVENWCKVYYRMSLHIDGACPQFQLPGAHSFTTPLNYFGAEYQDIFNNFLLNRHPREHEVTRQWRLSQYKPFTQAPFQEVIQVIAGAIFQDSGYSITCQNKEDNDYIWGENFEGHTLAGYYSAHFQDICNDPNGIFVVIPKEPWSATTTPRVEPVIHFIPSKRILWRDGDQVIFDHQGYVWVVNSLVHLRFKETKPDSGEYELADQGGYYAHSLGYIPAFVAGGLWNSQGFYDSWLTAARAIADEFVSAKSAEQLVMKEASHPFIIETATDCPDCTKGSIQYCSTCRNSGDNCICDSEHSNWSLKSCSSCGGSGLKSRNPADRLIAPSEDMDKDLIKIVSPDTAINKLHFEHNASLLNDMMRALHLNHIDEAQSGEAKERDMETRYQFIASINNDLFDRHIYGSVRAIISMRNVSVNAGVIRPANAEFTIVKPAQFKIETAADLLEKFDAATKAGLPAFLRAQHTIDYVDKQFGGDEVLKRKTTLITQMDPMAVYTASEKQSLVMSGAFTQRDLQFSANLSALMDQVQRSRGTDAFLKLTYDAVKTEVDSLFDALVPPPIRIQEPAASGA